MSGLPAQVLLRVARLRTTFRDEIGNSRIIQGTGFWLTYDGVDNFITNAHNVEPRMKLGKGTAFKFEGADIELRRRSDDGFVAETQYFRVIDPDLRLHATADVAIFASPQLQKNGNFFDHISFEQEHIADDAFLSTSLSPMDAASFLGYPGLPEAPWFDQHWNMAIARTVNIASWPAIGFSNEAIPTSDVILVSGLSFSGSSGSPVFSHAKGLKLLPESGLTGGDFVPPRIIGIMSGHLRETDGELDKFRHSGLSYLTRSTAILSLLTSTPAPSP